MEDRREVETDMSTVSRDFRMLEIRNRFVQYLNFLIKDFKSIDYDNIQSEEHRTTELLAKDFVKDLTKFLNILKSKVTILDILGSLPVEKYNDDMPVSISLFDKRFKNLTIHDNLIHLRSQTIDLGNNYSITAQGTPDAFTIIINNKVITAPKCKDTNPAGTILLYRVDKCVDSDDNEYYEHSICVAHPLANMNFIKHYIANLNFIRRYKESADELVEELAEKDDEDMKVDVESVETETETCEEKENFTDERELKMKSQFIEYLDYLIKDFKKIDYERAQGENRRTNGDLGARVIFYKTIINQLIKLLIVLKSKVTIRDVVGERKYDKFTSTHSVGIMISGRFPEISMPDGWDQYFLKELSLGNGREIGLFGVPKEREILIRNSNITSPRASRYNLKDNIIGYRIYQSFDSEGHATGFEHSIIFYNPVANLRFIKGYEDNDDPVEPEVEADDEDDDNSEWDVEEDDFQPEDWFPSDRREEENTETTQSDNNKTLNFSLPGPNGSKISINLNINITFDK